MLFRFHFVKEVNSAFKGEMPFNTENKRSIRALFKVSSGKYAEPAQIKEDNYLTQTEII